MSYNPAFVGDESPLAGSTSADHDQSNGIKLTSFKVLPSTTHIASISLNQDNDQKRHHHHHHHHNNTNSNSSNNNNNNNSQVVLNMRTSENVSKHHDKARTSKSQRNGNGTGNNQQVMSSSQNQNKALVAKQISAKEKACMSTSSSLSLIDNPTLSSLSPSAASSYSTASTSSSSFVSSSSAGLNAAVECRDMRYDVGRGRNQKTILHNINVTVPEGSIYGLLGPSGCGKTTMLRCVIGRIKPKEGYVRVFGYKPNDPGSQIPGPAIGYMPQEISVYSDFTINETLTYFGKINKMKQDLIDARIEFLLNFLDLPGKNRLIVSLSGGQKRRVSLAAALVHSPPLLILDEPTVGVDPLLRQSIWKHLVTLAETEKITIVITTHYIEEARQANVVGLMRHGKLLAEDSPDNLMSQHGMDNLEDVFLKLCISDSSRKAAKLAGLELNSNGGVNNGTKSALMMNLSKSSQLEPRKFVGLQGAGKSPLKKRQLLDANGLPIVQPLGSERVMAKKRRQFPSIFTLTDSEKCKAPSDAVEGAQLSCSVAIIQAAEQASSSSLQLDELEATTTGSHSLEDSSSPVKEDEDEDEQQVAGADFVVNRNNLRSMVPGTKYAPKKMSMSTWTKSLLAVIWKNYVRLKRNPPVLIFEFILPAVQVILFCLCIGGDPFDVPLAVVNDEVIPQASKLFLDAIDNHAIRQVPFTNLSEALDSVRRGETWGAIHIPDRYTQYLQERLTHPADITNETLTNGTINIYPDLTNLHLALAMENTFREAFIKFAKETLNMFGYDPEAAELPIKVEKPVYGTLVRNGYLEFMAPGVVISITYVMATGLTALAFILEKRDGLLERSLVSGVTTSQILLAHAAVQVVVMIIQIFLVLAFTFFVFEIPSNGPFIWVVLLILLQGCTGMGFGLLVSAVCEEENTAVMMLVGTFYTNLILAGIIWPLEAMPHWLRWFSYAQPQTLPTETLRNILSRGWGIGETGVYVGFLVTIGWLIVFLLLAGLCMRYTK